MIKNDVLKKKKALESSIFKLRDSGEGGLQFIGHVLQCVNIRYNDSIPTAGIYFDSKSKKYEMLLNSEFFCDRLSSDERCGVLIHEIYHIVFKHVFRVPPSDFREKTKLNIAMDLVINQLIANIPDGGMFIKDFKDKQGKPFPENKTTDFYLNLLENSKYKDGKENSDKNGHNRDKNGYMPTKDLLDKMVERRYHFDSHDWDGEDGSLKDKLEAVEGLLKRAKFNAEKSGCSIPGSIADQLQEITNQIKALDYKKILLSTLKKSLDSRDTSKTWSRPSRRYGELARGSKVGLLPSIAVYIDTSGSISYEEICTFLDIINGFLTVGINKAYIHLFNTELYHTERVKKNFKLNKDSIQIGGTDLSEVFAHMENNTVNLSLILTDGYYSRPEFNKRKIGETIFIISKSNGQLDHPLSDIGKTIPYEF